MSEGRRTRPIAGAGRGRGSRSPSGRGPGFQLQETQAVLPSPRAAAEDQYADNEEDGSMTPGINFKLSGLPDGVSKEEIEGYFGGQIDSEDDTAEIVSVVLLGSGKAKVVISGLTEEVVRKLQKKKYRIKKQPIFLEVDSSALVPRAVPASISQGELQSPKQFDTATHSVPPGPAKITVTGFPDAIDEYLLEMYFESPKSGGHEGAVEQCLIVTSGIAYITLKSPEVAAQVISNSGSHTLSGSPLHVRYYDESEPMEGYESNRLQLHKLPPGTRQDYLQLYLEGVLQMEHPQDFTCEVSGQSAVITFSQDHFGKELCEMITKLTKKPLKGAAIEAELCRLGDEEGSCKQVTLKLSGLPRGTTKERVEMYFEDQGDSVKVLSLKFQEPGSAKTVLSGLTVEEVKRLQQKKHKIMRQMISVEVVEIATVMELSQSNDVDPTLPTTITVSGFPDSVDEELLKIFFESSKSGGHEGAVEQCSIVAQGIAHVKFHSPDIATQIIAKSGSHTLSGSPLHVRSYDESEPMEGYESNRLQLHKLPPGTRQDYLQLYLEGVLQMEHPQDFTCEVSGQSAVITFSQDHSGKELCEMITRITKKPLRGAAIEAELCRLGDEEGSCKQVTLKLSGLPRGTTKEQVKTYFEGQGSSAEVVSTELQGHGKAKIVLSGLIVEEVETLQQKKHKISGQNIAVEVTQITTVMELSQSDSKDSPTLPTTITVSGFPDSVDEELLKIFFESSKSGGCEGAVEQCSIVAQGIAHVKFHSPDIATQVISKSGSHTLSGSPLRVRSYDESEPMEGYESNRLRLHKLPPGTRQDYLQLYLEGVLQMEHPQDFTCEVSGQSAVISFSQDHSGKELSEMIAKLKSKQLKGACIEAELCRVTSSIRVSNITEHYEDDYIQMYFENSRKSGGGEVTSVELLGNGEVVVTFNDPKVVNTILKRTHDSFGRGVAFSREEPSEVGLEMSFHDPTSSAPSLTHKAIPPLEIKDDPIIVESLKKSLKGLEGCVQNFHVQITIDAKTGTIWVKPTKRTIANWRKECERHLTTYIRSRYMRKERKVPKEAGSDIKKFLLSLPKETPIAISFNQDGTLLTTAGECDAMDIFHRQVEEICSAYDQMEESQTLTPEQYRYFTEMKQAEVTAGHSGVKIKMNPDNCTIILQGSVRNVKRLKQLLPKYVTHAEVLVPLQDPSIVQYLSTKDGKQHLSNFLQMKKCQVAVHFKQMPLSQLSLQFLCDGNQTESVRRCAEALRQQTSVNSFPLPKSFASMLPEIDDYDDLCRNLEKQFHVQVITMGQQVSVAGFESGVTKCSQSLTEFIREKCTVAKMIVIDKGKWRLFCTAMNVTWRNVLDQIRRDTVKVTIPTDEEAIKPQIVLKGDRTEVEKAFILITDLVKSIATGSIPLSRPGTCKFFRESEVLIHGIEFKQKVSIEITEIDSTATDVSVITDTTSPPKFTKVCVARTDEAKEIYLYVGDITEFTRAEVLVNAANKRLQHGAGVARAIADKGGPVIQHESTQYIKKRLGPLDDGDIWFTTKVGNLPYKALIHAVGPHWNGGRNKEQALLHKACYGSLHKAQNYISIAIPAIGAGLFGFPIDRSADALIGAAVEFSKSNPGAPMQEINFILHDQKDVNTFITALKKHIPTQNVFVSPTKHLFSPPVTQPTQPTMAVTSTPSRLSKKSKKKQTVVTPPCIKLHQGSLLDVKADVYINTTNKELDLTQGAVAKELAKAAGPGLQAECNKKAPIPIGGVAVTGAGKLPCRHVFHVNAPNYDGPGGQAEKLLRNIVQKCMKECTKLGMTSVAFPALGAGALHFPSDVVAKIMVREISSFLSSKKTTTLTAVHLVIFMKDIHQAFQKELTASKINDASFDTQPTLSSPQPATAGYYEPAFHTPPLSNSASPQIPLPGVQGFPFGNIMVQIDQGDITDDGSDAVVNTTNSSLRLDGGGVSTALLKKGGPELQKECDKITSRGNRLEEGKVIYTRATGILKCKSVFHTMFESRDPKKFMKTITACLQKAEELRYKSIAFPAIGTGVRGYPPEDAAQGVLQAIQQFASAKHSHLTNIRIILFQQNVYQAFLSIFQDADKTSQPASLNQAASNPGLFTRGINWLGSLWPSSGPDDSEGTTVPDDKPDQDEMMYKELEVRIYGEKESFVQEAEKMLHKIIEDQFVTEKVDNIANLTPEQTRELEKRSRELQVEIEINPSPLNYIRLRGDKGDVAKMKYEIVQMLGEFEKHAAKIREAEQMHKLVQWKHKDSQGAWNEYDPLVNFEIEQAFKFKQVTHEHRDKSEWFTIDFKTMEETNRISRDTYKVKRFDLEQQYREGDSRPSHWEPMPVDPATKREVYVHIVDLDPGDGEYQGALDKFQKTMRPGQNYNNMIKIQRIQNPALYGQYIARRKEMDKQNPKGHQNERQLFHGTSADTVPKINKQGYNRSFAGKNATVYGAGVYFARDASYSARGTYSPPDSSGHRYMYLARVLTGEFAQGDGSMLVPPPKDPQKDPNLLCDSVVNNLSNPEIFVIFFDSQFYPEYLITFD